jgi:hypothetical protein
MLHAALDPSDLATRIALVPNPVELLGGGPQLHDQIARQVLGLAFTAFFAPEAQQRSFVAAHDDPGI